MFQLNFMTKMLSRERLFIRNSFVYHLIKKTVYDYKKLVRFFNTVFRIKSDISLTFSNILTQFSIISFELVMGMNI